MKNSIVALWAAFVLLLVLQPWVNATGITLYSDNSDKHTVEVGKTAMQRNREFNSLVTLLLLLNQLLLGSLNSCTTIRNNFFIIQLQCYWMTIPFLNWPHLEHTNLIPPNIAYVCSNLKILDLLESIACIQFHLFLSANRQTCHTNINLDIFRPPPQTSTKRC